MKIKQANNLLKKVQSDYNQIAESFSDTRNKSWPEFEILFEKSQKYSPLTAHRSPQKILDLACGNGRLFDFLLSKFSVQTGRDLSTTNFEYTGLDNSSELLTQAKKLHQETPLLMKGGQGGFASCFKYGDILSIPAKDNSFDQIWCIAAFHHLPKEYQLQGAKEIYRVMKKDAILVITVWDLWQLRYIKEIFKAFLRNPLRIKNLFIPWKKGTNKVDRFYYAFTLNEFQKTFKKAGFQILEVFKTRHNFCLICKKTN